MADSLKRNPNSRSLRTFREDKEMKARTKDRQDKHLDSKTPPLPKNHIHNETLLRNRAAPRNKQQINKQRNKSNLESKSGTQQLMLYRIECKTDRNPKRPYQATSDITNLDHMQQIDSEDEDIIIEQRRKKRKQLLEKLSDLQNQQTSKRNVNKSKQTNDKKEANDKYNDDRRNKTKPEVKHLITDMFSEFEESSKRNIVSHKLKQLEINDSQLQDDWDDPEGYYHAKVGNEINNNQYYIKNVLGQGVFANVVRAYDNLNDTIVAIKIIRNNALMYDTGLKEISILKLINDRDPDNKYHCVRFFSHFIHKRHLCIVLEPLFMDMRGVIKMYGKNGLNIKAVMKYTRQLLLALQLLKKIGVVHADIKPDNILVNEKKNILKLCDFGSATTVGEAQSTPYLVSRFYRPPEIILGVLPYKYPVDMWSTACTIFEMVTGKILFTGSSNNKMLKCFMDVKGKFSNKLIRKSMFKDKHFNSRYNFLLHTKDKHTGKERAIEMCNITAVRNIHKELYSCCRNVNEHGEKKLLQLKDILERMLALDSIHRLSVEDGLRHAFLKEEQDK